MPCQDQENEDNPEAMESVASSTTLEPSATTQKPAAVPATLDTSTTDPWKEGKYCHLNKEGARDVVPEDVENKSECLSWCEKSEVLTCCHYGYGQCVGYREADVTLEDYYYKDGKFFAFLKSST